LPVATSNAPIASQAAADVTPQQHPANFEDILKSLANAK
jgi:hypothetical protein